MSVDLEELEEKIWWSYLHEDLRELLRQSVLLVKTVKKWDKSQSEERYSFRDYSFVVFPAAKAYEGFLKTLFLDIKVISEETFYGKRFRVGKALNPALKGHLRKKEGIYDKIVEICGGRDLADSLWSTWKTCRNLLFHWFPNEKNAITFEEAEQRVERVISSIDLAFGECKIDRKSD
jgi:hypothetical protein